MFKNRLEKGIFVSLNGQEKVWLPFKYECLPTFCFGCGHMGHGIKDCLMLLEGDRGKAEDELPYSVALKAESSALGRKSLLLGSLQKKIIKQCYYIGEEVAGKVDDVLIDSVQ